MSLVAMDATLAQDRKQSEQSAQTAAEAQRVKQQQEKSAKLAKELLSTDVSLSHASQNLAQISRGVSDLGFDAADKIGAISVRASTDISHLSDLALIYSMMAHPKDQAIVFLVMAPVAQGLLKDLDAGILHINNLLGALGNPAALTEAQKIRDGLRTQRELIARTFPNLTQ